MTDIIGKRGMIDQPIGMVAVRIKATREIFGRTDVLVEPIAGSGQAWVAVDRVKMGGKS